ncbi:MAG: PspC domain-containing protein [Anaerolineae bacterium]|nr:PspC domain-containing protein [Anaerolineae bacterium]
MSRSFTNRLFGGICGGLGNITPLSPWLWRVVFIVLAVITQGAAALAYLLLWWMLPLQSPTQRQSPNLLLTLFALLLSLGVIGGWFARDSIGLELYGALVVLLLALIFFLKQLRGGSFAIGSGLLIAAVVLLLGTLGTLPAGLQDIALRSWPALLVLIGLETLLRYRVRRIGGLLALVLSTALVVGAATLAYNNRVDQKRTENQITIEVPNLESNELAAISPEVTTLQIDLRTLDTDVVVSVVESDERVIHGEFLGGSNSDVEVFYEETGSLATFRITERYASDFPQLAAIGRADLRLQIPRGLALGMAFEGERGTANFDMAALNLERLDLTLVSGDALVTLPAYQPLSPSVQERPGTWLVQNGNLSVTVPQEVGARFLLARNRNSEPRPGQTYDDLLYRVELSGDDYVLISRQFENAAVQVTYRVDVRGGNLRLVSADGG